MNEKWFLLDIPEIEKKLKTNAACGISRKAARSRLRREGKNEFFYLRQRSISQCIKRVLSDPMLLLIIAVNVIAAIFGSVVTAIASGVMILLNLFASVFAYIKASRVAESMAEYSQPRVAVIRDGKLFRADARAVVRGDVILLSPGDIVPCDVRLISSDELTVICYEGKRSDGEERILKKNASHGVDDESVKLFEQENMVCAGSQIVSGTARAIAVETGKYTYIGALDGGIVLNNGADVLPALSNLKKISLAYSFIIMAVILPLTVAGIFTFGSERLLDVFMLIMALSVSALGELIYVIGGIVVSSGLLALAAESENDNNAIVKNISCLDKLAHPDYVLLLDDPALTNGSYRVTRLLIGDEELEGKQVISGNAFRFAELVMINEHIRSRSPSVSFSEERVLQDSLCIFGKQIGVDEGTFSDRVRTFTYYPSDGLSEVTAMLLHGERVSVFTSESSDMIDRCTAARTKNGNLPLDRESRNEIKQYISELRREGMRVLVCATSNAQQSGRPAAKGLILEGVAGFTKSRVPCAAEYIKALSDSGAKILAFTEKKSESKLASLSKMLGKSIKNDVVICDPTKDSAEEILKRADKYAIFAGFSELSIRDFVSKLEENGKTVESVGFLTRHLEIADASGVSVTFGDFDYKTSKVDFTRLESTPAGESESSREGAQTMRFASDVIVKRPTALGGGLGGICAAMKFARSIHLNLETLLVYLICMQSARALIAGVASVASGIFLLTYPQLLFSGLLLDFGVSMCCAFDSHESPSALLRTYSARNIFNRVKRPLVCSALAALAVVGTALPIAFITKADVARATFVSLSLMQICAFLLMRYENKVKKLFSPLAISIVAVGALVPILFSAIPALAGVFGAGASSAASLIIVLVAPSVFSLLYFFSCVKKTKK